MKLVTGRSFCRLLMLLALIAIGLGGFQALQWRQHKIAGLEIQKQPIVRPQAEPADVLLFGDSRIAQWRHLPERDYAIARHGYPGATAIQLAGRLPILLQETHPQLVIIGAGVNDAVAAALVSRQRRTQALADSLAALDQMVVAARQSGARVLLLKILPPVRPNLWRRTVYRGEVLAYVNALNEGLEDMAIRHDAAIADPLRLLLDDNGRMADEYRKDTLHLTAAAYDKLGVLLPPASEVQD